MKIGQALGNCSLDQTEAEILLSHILKKDRSFLHAYPENQLTNSQLSQFNSNLKRREGHEPLAYILGYKEFYGLKFLVNKNVMVPRDDTEDLVEEVLKEVKNLVNPTVADIGTGSGCIAISLAVNNPHVKVYATDISEEALKTANKNAQLYGVSSRITFLKGNLADQIETKVDLIVANLPYIHTSKINDLEPQVKNFEPKLALDGGGDGMDLYRQLFKQAERILKPNGKIFYEVDGNVFVK